MDEPTLIERGNGFTFEALALELAEADPPLCADRRFRVRTYTDCMIGSDCVTWLVDLLGITRPEAVSLGQALLLEGYLHHVVREQPFEDAEFFYRLTDPRGRLDRIELGDAIGSLRAQVPVADRRYRGSTYPACFVAADAIDVLSRAHDLGREDAASLGQRLLELGVFHHVVDDQQFRDGDFYYRFWTDEAH